MPIRLDRFLTLYCFGPFYKLFRPNSFRIPILMYHSISDEPESGHPYFWINTSPARFAEHMKYLHDNGYQVISLSEAVTLLSSTDSTNSVNSTNSTNVVNPTNSISSINPTAQRPDDPMTRRLNDPISQHSKYVVITFDDGYLDFYTHAFPLLRNYSYSATVFLPTAFINNKRSSFKQKHCMTWDEVRHLGKEGISFGSHTVNHPQLKNLNEKEIEDELRSSKEIIENETGIAVDSFSYPFAFPQEDGAFLTRYKEKLITHNYRMAVTTIIGRTFIGDDSFFLKRIPVNNGDDRLLFQSKLFGTYDWLRIPQYLLKVIKG